MYDGKKCNKCVYSAKVNEGDSCCIYILIEKQMRGCYGDGDCPKFKKRSRRRKAINTLGGFVYDD